MDAPDNLDLLPDTSSIIQLMVHELKVFLRRSLITLLVKSRLDLCMEESTCHKIAEIE